MITFYEWLIRENFQHPANIPTDFALAVYHVMHNMADADDWDIIDSSVATKGLKNTLEDIKQILIANHTPNIATELQWWKNEITGDMQTN
jgi:hypothetical protein